MSQEEKDQHVIISVNQECNENTPCKHKVECEEIEKLLSSPEIVKLLHENKLSIPDHFKNKLRVVNTGRLRYSIEIDGKVIFSGKPERIDKLIRQLRQK